MGNPCVDDVSKPITPQIQPAGDTAQAMCNVITLHVAGGKCVLKRVIRLVFAIFVALAAPRAVLANAGDTPMNVVCAENFYGDIVQQIGGKHVMVTSILVSPNQDPHLFEASASTARSLTHAKLVVYNGAGYDPWVEKLLSATKTRGRDVLVAASLVHQAIGSNPHLWYDPPTMAALATELAARLSTLDQQHAADYKSNLQIFLRSFIPLRRKILAMRAKYSGVQVTATEPVFDYMAQALGLTMRNLKFQMAVMNNTEPSASSVIAFEADLATRKVKALFYNRQVSDAAVERLIHIAKSAQVPVIGITETEPVELHYQDWMMSQLQAIDMALGGVKS